MVMPKKNNLAEIYFGWWATLFGGILSGLGGGIQRLGASALLLPIASEFGLSRAGASIAAGIGIIFNGLMLPLAGWFSDRFGPKGVIGAGILLMGSGLVLMNFINSLWSYYLVWGVLIGAGHGLGFTIAHDKLLSNWFIGRRGLAFGSRFAVMGIMEIVTLILIGYLITTQGWRVACLFCAGLVLSFGVFVLWRFVRQNCPEHYGLLPDGARVEICPDTDINDTIMVQSAEYAVNLEETEFTLRQAMRTTSFWIFIVSSILHSIMNQGFNLHCIPFLIDMGIDPLAAAGLMAMMVFFTIPSRFLGGIFADRFKKNRLKYLFAGATLLPAIGISVFLLNQTLVGVYVFLILFGIGAGAYMPLNLTIRGRFFGRKAYGSILGFSLLFAVPLSFLTSIYAGWTYDVTGSYANIFTMFAVLAFFDAAILCLLKVPRLAAVAA